MSKKIKKNDQQRNNPKRNGEVEKAMERPARWCGVITLFPPHEERKVIQRYFGLVFLILKEHIPKVIVSEGKREDERAGKSHYSNFQ